MIRFERAKPSDASHIHRLYQQLVNDQSVIINEDELLHTLNEHFAILPQEILLERIEIILKDPTISSFPEL